jgi:hypothetical protein
MISKEQNMSEKQPKNKLIAAQTTETMKREEQNMNEKRSQDKVFAARTTDEIIAVAQEEDDAAEREKILNNMTPTCRKKLEDFDNWLRTEVNHTLRRRYELGLQVKELYEDETKGGKLYGKNAIGRICKVLHWDDGVIRSALRFVLTYSQEDLESMCSLTLLTGEPLTWSHVRALMVVEDAKKRQALLDRTVAEGWTCTELAQEIKRLMDRPAGDGRGRPPRLPKDFDGAVAQQQQSAEEWDRRYSKVWAKSDRSLVAQAAKLPPEEVTEERLHQARELANHLRTVADQAVAQAEKAEEVVRDFEHILAERRQGETPSEPAAAKRRKTA